MKIIYFVVSQRACKATGPVSVAMAKGTFVRSESRPMEVLMLKRGIDRGHVIVQDRGTKKRVESTFGGCWEYLL